MKPLVEQTIKNASNSTHGYLTQEVQKMWKNGRLTRVLSVSDGKISSSYGTKLASRYTVFGALLYDLKKEIIMNFSVVLEAN